MRGWLGARSEFDGGDEDYPPCGNCVDGSGWTVWRTRIFDENRELWPVTLFVGCADCNDDGLKPYPIPWPICQICEESLQFCECASDVELGTLASLSQPHRRN